MHHEAKFQKLLMKGGGSAFFQAGGVKFGGFDFSLSPSLLLTGSSYHGRMLYQC